MSFNVDGLQERVIFDRRPARKPRACFHCHVRKVRCDAWEVGLPCTRCKVRKQTSTCVLVNPLHRGPSSSNKRQRTLPNQPAPVLSSDPEINAEIREQGLCPPNDQVHRLENLQTRTGSTPPILGEVAAVAPFNQQSSRRQSHHPQQLRPHEPQQSQREQSISPPAEEQQQIPEELGDSPTMEEDVHFRICQEMSRRRPAAMSPLTKEQNSNQREVIEYHEGINSMTILGEALGQQRPNRLVRVVVVDDTNFNVDALQSSSALDEADMAYLRAKGALHFPPRPVCDELLRLYFTSIYPYAPILDRVKFVQDYKANRISPFLLQSILANAVPCASKKVLHEAGYQDRITAQKSLFTKARLLYDIGCEKNQLCLLQGSIMLSSLSFAYALDKDYRYWLSNAARIATQIGLHRNYASETLDNPTRRLFRRIWWVLYNRDTLLAISGLDNLRRFNDRYCDTCPLTESDWDEEQEKHSDLIDILSPIPRTQKLFMVEYSKLSIISGLFIRDFKTPGSMPSREQIEKLSHRITLWRKDLPAEMQVAPLQEWTSENLWILVLMAMNFRLEAVFCRAAKERYRVMNDSVSMERTSQQQENAMFELSIIIQRASMHELLHLCPLSFMTCASTILAMRIENALDPAISPRKLLATKTQIFAELEYIRESCEYWSSLVWTLRMFEAVIARTRLGLFPNSPSAAKKGNTDTESINPGTEMRSIGGDSLSRDTEDWDGGIFSANPDVNQTLSVSDDIFGILPVTDNYDWLQDLLASKHHDDFLDPFNSI